MHWALRFGFGMGVVSINDFLVCLESLPNFHGEDLAAFCLIFVVEIWQRFTLDVEGNSGFVSHTKLTAKATFMDLFHS